MINSRKRRDTAEVNDYLKKQMSVPKDKRITRETLKQLNIKLLDEISKCVLVPKGFHDWMHRHVKIDNGKYIIGNDEKYVRDRDDFYDFYQDYSRNESYIDEITEFKINDDTMKNAVNSLKILISVATGEENFSDEIKKIHDIFMTSKTKIIQQQRKPRD